MMGKMVHPGYEAERGERELQERSFVFEMNLRINLPTLRVEDIPTASHSPKGE